MADKWTPGPWFAVPYGDGKDLVFCKDEAGNSRISFMADLQERRKAWREIHANARLISKAPELVDALRMVLDEGHSYESEGMARDYARDLLREIEGE